MLGSTTLTTGHEIGLGLSALAFVVFALVSSVLIPRRDPDFPGRHKSLYIFLCLVFFAWMIAAVAIFGKESKTPKNEGKAAAVVSAHRS